MYIQALFIMLTLGTSFNLFALNITSPAKKLGNVWQGSKVKFVYPLKNNSSRTVKIIGVHAGCGCVMQKRIPKEIKPGASSALELILDTTQFLGSVKKSISFMYKERSIVTKLLSVHAFVKAEFSVEPPVLLFDPRHTSRTLTITKNNGNGALGELIYRDDWFVVSSKQGLESSTISYNIKAKPAFLSRGSSSDFSLSTSSRHLPSIALKAINLSKVNKLSELSKPVDFGFIKKDANVEREIPLGKLISQHFSDDAQVFVADERILDHSEIFSYELLRRGQQQFLKVKISNVEDTFGFVRGKIKIRHKNGSLLYALNTVGYLSK